jgi:Uma2 family endonuclease
VATVQAQALLTAEEYAKRPDPGHPEELVRGRIAPMPQPNRRHGQICGQTVYLLRRFLDDHDLGHVLSNDAGVITERGPDTVRGADVAFYSFARLPKGPLPASYGPEVPELVIEVRSPTDRWPKLLAKVAEYLEAGVLVVVVLDPEPRTAHVYGADQPVRILGPDDELTLPEILGDFRVPVRRFFE